MELAELVALVLGEVEVTAKCGVPTKKQITDAANALVCGELVVMPTETVYGLAADATNPAAVREVFRLKGRPAGHPLIVHARDPRPWAEFDMRAEQLAALWPGPLTLVLPGKGAVAAEVGGGHRTLAVRLIAPVVPCPPKGAYCIVGGDFIVH